MDTYDAEERSKEYLKNTCLAKLVCDKKNNEKVLGFHFLGPNAGEVAQGYALAVKKGVTKQHFDAMVGIHPTVAEEFTTLSTTLSSGKDVMKAGGC